MIALAALLAAQLFLLGANAVAPFRLARAEEPRRAAFALAALPLLLAALLLALFHLRLAPDAAFAWGLAWPPQALPARIVLVVAAAGGLGALVVALGGRRLEPAAWRAAGALGVFLAAGAALAGELLRVGGGPSGSRSALLLAAAGRFALTLSAGEAATGRPRWLAPLAAALLPLGYVAAPAALKAELRPDLLSLGAAALLLFAAPFLPERFRRPAAVAGVLVAALYLSRAAGASATLEMRGFGPASAPAPTAGP